VNLSVFVDTHQLFNRSYIVNQLHFGFGMSYNVFTKCLFKSVAVNRVLFQSLRYKFKALQYRNRLALYKLIVGSDNSQTLFNVVELALYVFEQGFRALLLLQNFINDSDELLVIWLIVCVKYTSKDILIRLMAYKGFNDRFFK
jgi:hypothetical protein